MRERLERWWRTAPVAVLGRLFFGRFFENEHVSPGTEARTGVIHALAFVAAPGTVLPLMLGPGYAWLSSRAPEDLQRALWAHRGLFVTLSMILMGGLAVLAWDALFPDLRDARVLGPLPVPARVIFAGKLGALSLFVLLFTLAIVTFPAVLYPAAVETGRVPGVTAWSTLRAHVVANGLAALFSFAAVAALEGVLLVVLPRRLFRRASGAAQAALVVALFLLLFSLPAWTQAAYAASCGRGAPPRWSPAAWFTILYDVLQRGPGAWDGVERWPVRATVAALAVCAVAYALSYRRYVARRTEDLVDERRAPGAASRAGRALLAATVLRRPAARAACAFTLATVARSPRHRLIVAAFLGLATAIATRCVLAAAGAAASHDAVGVPDTALLAIGPVFVFCATFGLRAAAVRPAEPRAHWVFRVLPYPDPRAVRHGVRVAFALFAVLPFTLAPWPVYALAWGPAQATRHAALTGAAGLVLVEVALAGFRRIPFTALRRPAGTHAWALFPVWVFAFSLFTWELARLESLWLADPARFDLPLAGGVLALAGAAALRTRLVRPAPPEFGEEGEPVLHTLGL